MPPAPTAIRRHLLGNAHVADASTYGEGSSTSSIAPNSGTCPPNRLQITPCPVSCTALIDTNARHSPTHCDGASAPLNAALSSSVFPSAADTPHPTHAR